MATTWLPGNSHSTSPGLPHTQQPRAVPEQSKTDSCILSLQLPVQKELLTHWEFARDNILPWNASMWDLIWHITREAVYFKTAAYPSCKHTYARNCVFTFDTFHAGLRSRVWELKLPLWIKAHFPIFFKKQTSKQCRAILNISWNKVWGFRLASCSFHNIKQNKGIEVRFLFCIAQPLEGRWQFHTYEVQSLAHFQKEIQETLGAEITL